MIFKGFKQIGIQYISQSIESYLSAILGSQAKTKQPIISARGSPLETQQKFRKLVSDTIQNYDVSMSINNINRAISDTNIVLNLAISPSLWLLPSSLIILKNPIHGYNNRLKVATRDMKFDANNINYYGTINRSKNVHQNMKAPHLETLDEKTLIGPKVHKEVENQLETLENKPHIEPKRCHKFKYYLIT